MTVALLRELIEDVGRHQADSRQNNSTCKIIKFNKVITKDWKSIGVGELIVIHNDERIPADALVVGTSNTGGRCYMETSTLDGEKNLKPRQMLTEGPASFLKVQVDDSRIVNLVKADIHLQVAVPKPSMILG